MSPARACTQRPAPRHVAATPRYHRAVRVLHVINCLSLGGAERQLLALAAAQQRAGDEVQVVTLLAKDALRSEAEAANLGVRSLDLRSVLGAAFVVRRLRRAIAEFNPDLVQSWLYYANLASFLALGQRRWLRRPLAWNLRQTLPDLARERCLMRRAILMGAGWSPAVNGLVYNSETSATQHRGIGYSNPVEQIIPNGFEAGRFQRGPQAREASRRILELPFDATIVAHAARWHPMKDHEGFLRAVAPLLASRPNLLVAMFGRDVTPDRLRGVISQTPALHTALARNRLRFLGERLDLPTLHPAFDLVVGSSAWGEAFPNVLAEAMASEVGVVATHVGESRMIVADDRFIVPPSRPDLLGAAIARWLDLPAAEQAAVRAEGRARIVEHFEIESVLGRYRMFWARVIERHAAGTPRDPIIERHD